MISLIFLCVIGAALAVPGENVPVINTEPELVGTVIADNKNYFDNPFFKKIYTPVIGTNVPLGGKNFPAVGKSGQVVVDPVDLGVVEYPSFHHHKHPPHVNPEIPYTSSGRAAFQPAVNFNPLGLEYNYYHHHKYPPHVNAVPYTTPARAAFDNILGFEPVGYTTRIVSLPTDVPSPYRAFQFPTAKTTTPTYLTQGTVPPPRVGYVKEFNPFGYPNQIRYYQPYRGDAGYQYPVYKGGEYVQYQPFKGYREDYFIPPYFGKGYVTPFA